MTETPGGLNREQVCKEISCSPRKLSYMIERNQFPRGVRRGRHDYWSTTTIENWFLTQFKAQEAWRPLMNSVIEESFAQPQPRQKRSS